MLWVFLCIMWFTKELARSSNTQWGLWTIVLKHKSKTYDVSLSWRKSNLPVMLKCSVWKELQGNATQVFRSLGNDPALTLWSWFWWPIDNLGDQTLFSKWSLCEFGLLETWDLATYRSGGTHGIARDQSTWTFCQRDLHPSPISASD